MSISRTLLSAALAGGLVLGCAAPARAENPLSRTMPGDVGPGGGTPDLSFDRFSWQSFAAINAPMAGGEIGTKDDAPTVWEHWMSDFQILEAAGAPPAWGTPPRFPKGCEDAVDPLPDGTRLLRAVSKRDGFRKLKAFESGEALEHDTTPGDGPLIDQNGKYVLFEIAVNQAMYNFIVQNKLYSTAGQKAYLPGKPVSFPASSLGSTAEGAVMVKAAWKTLGKNDLASQFHTSFAIVNDPLAKNHCRMVKVGLVGLHISRKTAQFPKWVWSTFEQVANAPSLKAPGKGPYNFNSGAPVPRTLTAAAKINMPPSPPWRPYVGNKTPVEVVRLIPVTATAAAVNKTYASDIRAKNPSSVFANYMLVGTQHPTDNDSVSDKAGEPFPQFLANTTMETFLQGDSTGTPAPKVTSNCGGCHYGATMTDQRPSDFTFILSRVTAP